MRRCPRYLRSLRVRRRPRFTRSLAAASKERRIYCSKLCQQNEMEKHGKSNKIKCQIEVETRRTLWDIVEEIYRDPKVSPKPEDGEYQCERSSGPKL